MSIKFTTTLSVQGMSAPAQPAGTGKGELRQWIRARKVWRKQAELIAAGATEGAGRVAKIIYDKSQEYVPVGDTRVLKDTASYGIVQSASLGSDPIISVEKQEIEGSDRYKKITRVVQGGVGATGAVFAVVYPASYARIVHDRVYGPSGKKVYHADPTGAFFLSRAVEETRDQCEEALASAVNDWVKSKGRRGGYTMSGVGGFKAEGLQDVGSEGFDTAKAHDKKNRGISKASMSQTERRFKDLGDRAKASGSEKLKARHEKAAARYLKMRKIADRLEKKARKAELEAAALFEERREWSRGARTHTGQRTREAAYTENLLRKIGEDPD